MTLAATVAARPRLPELDWMRGLVMLLMAIDHASGAFNAGRVFSDSARMYRAGTLLPADQFLTRFITHLCAPTFVFLAGAAAALSAERRLRAGERPAAIDRYLVQRGLLIALLDPLWMSFAFTFFQPVLLQVLYAIGTCMMAMALLRRLSSRWLLAFGFGWMLAGEAITGGLLALFAPGPPPLALSLLVSGGQYDHLIVAYPLVPWLAIMAPGWAFGRWLAFASVPRPARVLGLLGIAALALFALVRGVNGYGNMSLPRDDASLVQWLHVSKYPPSLSYDALELGLMALLLACMFALARARSARGRDLPAWTTPLLVLGQSAFLFYLLHAHLLEGAAVAAGLRSKLPLWSAYAGALAVTLVLYPICAAYRRYKQAHPEGWTRYL